MLEKGVSRWPKECGVGYQERIKTASRTLNGVATRYVVGAIKIVASSACLISAIRYFEALLANSSDGNRRTSVNGDFDVRHLSNASLAFARRAYFECDFLAEGAAAGRMAKAGAACASRGRCRGPGPCGWLRVAG